jgi:6-phosphogluconolactonase (cycloisomerase 2 family)
MYVAAEGAKQIWGYRANFNTGALTLINGLPFATSQTGPKLIVVDPSKTFAYVAEVVATAGTPPTNYIESFSIDASGALVPTGNGPVQFGGTGAISAMLMDPAGKFLVVATEFFQDTAGVQYPSTLRVFSASSGTLTQNGSTMNVSDPAALPDQPSVTGMGLQTTLNLLYITDKTTGGSNGQIVTYQFDPNAGTLSSPLGLLTVAVGFGPSAISLSPTGNFLYVANHDSSNVSGFRVVPSNQQSPGSLQPIAGSPVPAGMGPIALAVDPSEKYLYVADHDSNQVSGYKINSSTGALTPVSSSPFNAGAGPSYLVISPTNKYLYVSNNSASTVSAMGIDPSTGNLGPNAPVSSGIQPMGIAFGR